MAFKPEELKRLNDALLSAYTYNSFERMLLFQLGKHLGHIASGGFQNVVFKVLAVAEREGWTDELVHAAHDANPGNPLLKAFVQNYVRYQGAAASLERIIDETHSFLDVARWRSALERIEHQVCQIRIDGSAKGTGFLIHEDVVLTNFHVIQSLTGDNPKPASSAQLLFDFKKTADDNILNNGVTYKLVSDSWLIDSSRYSEAEGQDNFEPLPAPHELDFAVLRVAPIPNANGEMVKPGSEPIAGSSHRTRGWIQVPAQPTELIAESAVFVMQHPLKEPLKMALKTNSLIGLNANHTRLRHRTNTDHGSSGSPCFNSDWKLIALHHAGSPNNSATEWNQAVPISTIRAYWAENGRLGTILGEQHTRALTEPEDNMLLGQTDDFNPDDEANGMLQ